MSNKTNNDRSLDYLTRETIREECGINGAKLNQKDCDRVLEEVKRLNERGESDHCGVYWIANRLAGNGEIYPYWD